MNRDMTEVQFRAACERRGFRKVFMGLGYYSLPDTPVQVWARNGGPRRRDQLAYLIREHAKILEKKNTQTERNP